MPCFDLLSEEEKRAVAAYDRGAVLCTAMAGTNFEHYGIKPEILFEDGFSDRPTVAFAFGCEVGAETREAIAALLAEDDGTPNLDKDPSRIEEPQYTLSDTLVFAKVTTGFRDAMARLLSAIQDSPFIINKANMILKMVLA